MKLTIIGGGSVRTPRMIPSLVRRAARLDLHELWLMDIDADKLKLIGSLCQAMAEQLGAPFRVVLSTDAREALSGAAHIITSIRPGFEQGRAVDERIAFDHGVLGQETTGVAGFAMAMRSLPAILDYCRLAESVAPGAWVYNFTNPAGLVAQGLTDAGIQRVVGICDSANGAQNAASRYLDVPLARVQHEVFGLNHLSWTRSVRIDPDPNGSGGEEVLPALLSDEKFIAATHMAIFDPAVRTSLHMFLNEYLHYFYHRDEALAALRAKPITRGQEVQHSRFWRLLQDDRAPMFGVFTSYEQQLLRDWIERCPDATAWSAGPAGATLHRPVQRFRQRTARPNVGLAAVAGHAGNDFDAELEVLGNRLTSATDMAEEMSLLSGFMSPGNHHLPAGLHATRLFSRRFAGHA